MLLDISSIINYQIYGYIFLGLMVLLVFAILSIFIKNGLGGAILTIIKYVILYFCIIYLYPVFNSLVYQYIPIGERALIFSGTVIKDIIAWVPIVIIYCILTPICNKLSEKILENGVIPASKFFGFVVSIPTLLVLSYLLTAITTSSYIVRGSKEARNNKLNSYYINYVFNPIKEGLKHNNIVSDGTEYVVNKSIDIKDPNFYNYVDSLNNIVDYFDLGSSYYDALETNNDKKQSILDMNTLMNITNTDNSINSKINKVIVNSLESYIKLFKEDNIDIGEIKEEFINNSINKGCSDDTNDYIYYYLGGTCSYSPIKTLDELENPSEDEEEIIEPSNDNLG